MITQMNLSGAYRYAHIDLGGKAYYVELNDQVQNCAAYTVYMTRDRKGRSDKRYRLINNEKVSETLIRHAMEKVFLYA